MTDTIRLGHTIENRPKTAAAVGLSARIKLAALFGQNERDFYLRIKSIESSQLFRKLFWPEQGSQRVITFARPYGLRLSERFLEIKDDITPCGGRLDVQSLLESRGRAAAAIRAMGEERFKEHFLLNEAGIDPAAAARRCGIGAREAREIIELLDELASHSEFYDNSIIAPESGINYNKIAEISKDGSGRFKISYYLPHLAKGRYSIDYEKLREQKSIGVYSLEEASQIDALVKQLEVINIRKAVIHRLLEEIIEFQAEFLRTGLVEDLVPFSQKAAAKRIEAGPSIVNRAIYARSVTVPSGRELALRDFFPSKKDVVKSIIRELMAPGGKPLSDKELSRALIEKRGYRVSRHLAQIYRKELGIAAVKGKNG